MTTICFSSFAYNYLDRANVMAKSLRRHHPDWQIWGVVPDRRPEGLPASALAQFDRVIEAASLGIPDFPAWMFRHDLIEAATAVKGRVLRLILSQPGVTRAVYLDPDMALFAPIEPLLASPDGPAIVLTPHQLAANTLRATVDENERTTMRYGVYNLGFLSVANDAVGREFATWWSDRLDEACYDATEIGLFTDQKYCDLVPGLFPRVHISRDEGCNVASWNLSRRRLHFGPEGVLFANDAILRLYHFTKIGHPAGLPAPGDVMTERYAGDNVEVHELVAWYKRQMLQNAVPAVTGHTWAYALFADGTPIPRAARLAWRDDPGLRARFPDPFDPAFAAFFQSPADVPPLPESP